MIRSSKKEMIERKATRIFNIQQMKDAAKPSDDWLSKVSQLKEIAASKALTAGGAYEKLPALRLKLLDGCPDDADLLVVKALSDPHESATEDRTKVFDVDVVFSTNKQISTGKYSCWYSYKVFIDEMERYIQQYAVDGSIVGQTFVIANVGESTPKKKGNRPAKLFRIYPAPQ